MGTTLNLTTKECPSCAQPIRRRAAICRFCGYDLQAGAPTKPRRKARPGVEGEALGCGLYLVLSSALFAIVVLLFFLLAAPR
jgi:hypothetical protein